MSSTLGLETQINMALDSLHENLKSAADVKTFRQKHRILSDFIRGGSHMVMIGNVKFTLDQSHDTQEPTIQIPHYMEGSLRILRAMIVDDNITTEQTLNHIDYLIHIALLARACSWEKVLEYDTIYRREQFEGGYPWGMANPQLIEQLLAKIQCENNNGLDDSYEDSDGLDCCEEEDSFVENSKMEDLKRELRPVRKKEGYSDHEVECKEEPISEEEELNEQVSDDVKPGPEPKLKQLTITSFTTTRKKTRSRKVKLKRSEPLKAKAKWHKKEPHICSVCGESFIQKRGLDSHMLKHTGEKPFKCELCGLGFISGKQLNKHKKNHSDERPVNCQLCDKTFKDKAGLKSHMNHVHNEARPFKCSTCAKFFKSKGQLRIHEAYHGEKHFKCMICNKEYALAAHLKMHMTIHTGERPYLCQHCPKAYRYPSQLKEHLMLHAERKQFTCDTCGKSFNYANSLCKHNKIHTGDLPHGCDVCGARFYKKTALVHHMRRHTGEKPFQCDICPKAFTQAGALKRHQITHTGEKPYKCETCGKCFGHEATLTKHRFVHTREKPFVCDICSKAFPWSHLLKKHLKSHEATNSTPAHSGSTKSTPTTYPSPSQDPHYQPPTMGSPPDFPASQQFHPYRPLHAPPPHELPTPPLPDPGPDHGRPHQAGAPELRGLAPNSLPVLESQQHYLPPPHPGVIGHYANPYAIHPHEHGNM